MRNNDLISRTAAMNLFIEKPPEYYHTSYIVGELNCLPSVDAVPVVHGRWMTYDDRWIDTHYQCSECGYEWFLEDGNPIDNGMNFCPNCGAKMDEEKPTCGPDYCEI